jgi:hypothetical protein
MKDLTEKFKAIIGSNTNWRFSLFHISLETLRSNNINCSFWEGEETWASIIINDEVVGYIWEKYPLIAIEQRVISQIGSMLKDVDEIHFIEVESLSRDLFKIESDEIISIVGYGTFTMEDLWFYTNSK